MTLFACAVQLDGGRVPESFRANIEASLFCRERIIRWHTARGFLGAVGALPNGPRVSVARLGQAIAIGSARLDNRRDVARWTGGSADDEHDLALALRFVIQDNNARIGELLGDFAFVVWNPARRILLAARDVFGVRPLFHARLSSETVMFSSHASLLARDDCYDLQYLVGRVAQSGAESARTVFAGVSAVPPASVARLHARSLVATRYWSAADAQARGVTAAPTAPQEQCDAFRALLVESMRLRLSAHEPTWSQLSGGLDSSSVVSIAQWLAQRGAIDRGLAGTVTYVDMLSTSADEKEYSDAVVAQYGVRNELIPHRQDLGALHDDPLLLDQPNLSYTTALRDRSAARLVHAAGGRVLLTGEGGDSLVAGTMFFFADWLVTGRAREAVREMAHRAAVGRVSFWRLAYENALMPLLPSCIRRTLLRSRAGSVPPWILPAVARSFAHSASPHERVYGGRWGRKYTDAVATTIDAIPSSMLLTPADELIEHRHPYLYRPLVEFALALPPEMCVRPHARKWILREAMRGILPEKVRTRVGKGALDGINLWSLLNDRERIDRLLHDPILAQLGVIDGALLRRLMGDVREGKEVPAAWRDQIGSMLEVEMWLRLRSGRWAAMESQSSTRKEVVEAGGPFIGQSSRSIV